MSKHILIIDDDPHILAQLSRILSDAGYRVDCAEDGQKGLMILTDTTPDLVITDMMMPNIDGFEFIVALRKLKPEVKVIAISGGGAGIGPSVLLESAKLIKAEKSLMKPVSKADLIECVEQVIG